MANDEHVALLKQGVDAWNAWRDEHPSIRPDLRGANIKEADLYKANLTEADLREAGLIETNLKRAFLTRANLTEANLYKANLTEAYCRVADLSNTNLIEANLTETYLDKANLSGANLSRASLSGAKLNGANFSGANLQSADMEDTYLTDADLTGCRIYGVSAWGLKLEGTKQQNLVITRTTEPEITVDNIEVAQFIYLLLHNKKIRDVIDTITSKAVLILGRFTDERGRPCSTPYARNCASETTCRSCSTLKSPGAAIRTRRSRCSLGWRGS